MNGQNDLHEEPLEIRTEESKVLKRLKTTVDSSTRSGGWSRTRVKSMVCWLTSHRQSISVCIARMRLPWAATVFAQNPTALIV